MNAKRKLRLGVIGVGKAYNFLSKALADSSRIDLVAIADPSEVARSRFANSVRSYAEAARLIADHEVEAIYIATPPKTHVTLTCAAAEAGKHVMVEKPMALCLSECNAMVEAAQKANICLLVGHTHSYDVPIKMAWTIIHSGDYGDLRHITCLNYNNFMTRPRAPDAHTSENGGGAILNQGYHQVDVARLLGGGLVDRVTSSVGFWTGRYPCEGAYTANLRFEGGATATLIYSGYGRFDSDEFCGWIGETGLPKRRSSVEAKLSEYQQRYHEHFGLVIASCEHADIRPTPEGVFIYCEHEVKFVRALEVVAPRMEVVDEMFCTIVLGEAPLHSGQWGLATQEVCHAIQSGAQSGGSLKYQTESIFVSNKQMNEHSMGR